MKPPVSEVTSIRVGRDRLYGQPSSNYARNNAQMDYWQDAHYHARCDDGPNNHVIQITCHTKVRKCHTILDLDSGQSLLIDCGPDASSRE